MSNAGPPPPPPPIGGFSVPASAQGVGPPPPPPILPSTQQLSVRAVATTKNVNPTQTADELARHRASLESIHDRIDSSTWESSLKSMWLSGTGQGGVLFCEFEEPRGAVVLKSASSIAEEHTATQLASSLLGLRCPEARICLLYTSPSPRDRG